MGFDYTDRGRDSVYHDDREDGCTDCALPPNTPVAIPVAGGLDRRTFLSLAMMSAAAVALAACGLDSATGRR